MRADSVIELLMNVPKPWQKNSFTFSKSCKVQSDPNNVTNGNAINVAHSKSSSMFPEFMDNVNRERSSLKNNKQMTNPSVQNEMDQNNSSIADADNSNFSHFLRRKTSNEKYSLQQVTKMM